MSKEEKSLYEQMGRTYAEIDGIFYPNITLGDELAEQNDFCGKYGDMWKKYMHDNRNADYRHYLFTGKLNEKAKGQERRMVAVAGKMEWRKVRMQAYLDKKLWLMMSRRIISFLIFLLECKNLRKRD